MPPGVGLTLAMGQVRVGAEVRNLTFAQTNNGPVPTDSGFNLAAIDTSTGADAVGVRAPLPGTAHSG